MRPRRNRVERGDQHALGADCDPDYGEPFAPLITASAEAGEPAP
jgi:hypothetical protein